MGYGQVDRGTGHAGHRHHHRLRADVITLYLSDADSNLKTLAVTVGGVSAALSYAAVPPGLVGVVAPAAWRRRWPMRGAGGERIRHLQTDPRGR